MQRVHSLSFALIALWLPAARAQEPVPDRRPSTAPRFVTNRVGSFQLPLPDEDDVIFFAIFGDRTGGPAEGIEVLSQAVDDVNLLVPELVMTVGDLVEGYGNTASWLEEAREYKSVMDRLDCPWFPVAGNHDTYWRNDTQEATRLEHDGEYESHFGPLWYAFRHKSAWFVVLYTDEGHPETGKKGFKDPEEQRISPEQLAWLEETLQRSAEAEHVFVFVHHPRWIGGGYGDDWDRVHRLLADAGNVEAVFAGHIHHMRYDGVRDGIEYFTLATVGAVIPGSVPEAGYLHEYHLVTVRKDRLGVATFPVGSAMNPRAITPEVGDEAELLARTRRPRNYWSTVAIHADDTFGGHWELEVENTVSRPIEMTWSAHSDDSRWHFGPDHGHLTLAPGARERFSLAGGRSGVVDGTFRLPEISFAIDYLAEGWRVHLPGKVAALPLDLGALAAPVPSGEEFVLDLGDDRGHLRVDHDRLALPDGPMTVEAWVSARSVGGFQGIISKIDGAEFALALEDGVPLFLAHLGGSWASAKAERTTLALGAWQHLAGVFDGSEVRTYVDGVLVAQKAAEGTRKVRRTPLLVGAEVDGLGAATDPFTGAIDEVRISSVARYTGERFEPRRRYAPDPATVLLFHMDAERGVWQFDSSGHAAHGLRLGAATVVALDETGR